MKQELMLVDLNHGTAQMTQKQYEEHKRVKKVIGWDDLLKNYEEIDSSTLNAK